MKKLILLTLVCFVSVAHAANPFAHAMNAVELYEEAQTYILSSSIDDVFGYLGRTIPSGVGPNEILPDDVLAQVSEHPQLSVRHVPRLLELAWISVSRKKASSDDRMIAFEKFVRSHIVFNLSGDERSTAIVEELAHELGQRIDIAFTQWATLSPIEREMNARLLSDIVYATNEPEMLQRLNWFAQVASPREFVVFNANVEGSAGATLAAKALPGSDHRFAHLTMGTPRNKFQLWLYKEVPRLGSMRIASQALWSLESSNIESKFNESWSADKTAFWLESVMKNGNRNYAQRAIEILETLMKHGDPKVAELLHSSLVKQGLAAVDEKFENLRSRVHEIQARASVSDAQIGSLRLDAIARKHAKTAAAERRAQGAAICRDLFL